MRSEVCLAKLVVGLPDPNIELLVNGDQKPDKISFNVGLTIFNLFVTSIDKSTSRVSCESYKSYITDNLDDQPFILN